MAVELARALIHEVVVDDSKAVAGAQNVAKAMDGMASASDKATAAAGRQANGLKLLDEAAVKLTRAQESAWGALQKWKGQADDNERAIQRLARAEADLSRAVQQGMATEEEKIRVLDQLRQKLSGVAVANDNLARSMQVFDAMKGRLDPAAAAYASLNKEAEALDALLAAGRITVQDHVQWMGKLAAEIDKVSGKTAQLAAIEAARAQQRAQDAQRRFNDALGVQDRPVTGSAAAAAAVFEEAARAADKEAKALAELQARARTLTEAIDPAAKAQRVFSERMAEADELLDKGLISYEQHAIAAKQYHDSMRVATGAARDFAVAEEKMSLGLLFKANPYLSRNIMDVSNVLIATRGDIISVLPALIDLKDQFSDAYTKAKQMSGGAEDAADAANGVGDAAGAAAGAIGGLAGQAGAAQARVAGFVGTLGLSTAGLVAVGATLLTVAAAVTATVAAHYAYASSAEEVDKINHLYGASVGLTTEQLLAQADAVADAAGVSKLMAREIQNAYLGTGKIGAQVMTDLTKITRDYAAANEQGIDQAANELAGLFSDPSKAVDELNKKYRMFDDSQTQLIRNYQAQGQLERAQIIILDEMRNRIQGAGERLAWYTKLWERARGLRDDAGSLVAPATKQEEADFLQRRLSGATGKLSSREVADLTAQLSALQQEISNDAIAAWAAEVRADFAKATTTVGEFARSVDPAQAAATNYANAQKLINDAVAKYPELQDIGTQALKLFKAQLLDAMNPAQAFALEMDRQAKVMEAAAGRARDFEQQRQDILRRFPQQGGQLTPAQEADISAGLDAKYAAQAKDNHRIAQEAIEDARLLAAAQASGSPAAMVAAQAQVAHNKVIRETTDAMHPLGDAQAAQKAKTDALAKGYVELSGRIGAQVVQLNQQTAAQERLAAAAGQGEAAMRRASIENQVAAASLQGLGAATRAALEAQEVAARSQIHADFVGAISAEVAATERLVAGMQMGAAATREAEIYNEAYAQTLKEAAPSEADFGKRLAENIAHLERKAKALDSKAFADYAQQLEAQTRQLQLQQRLLGATPQQAARIQAEHAINELLRERKTTYDALSADERARLDMLRDQATANADLELSIQRQQDAMEAVASSLERAFDRVGDALVDAMVEGKAETVDWGNVTRGIIASIASDLLKLAVAAPLKNAIFGTNSATLWDIGGAGATQAVTIGGQSYVPAGGQSGGISLTSNTGLGGFNTSMLNGSWLDRQLDGAITGANSWLNQPIAAGASYVAPQAATAAKAANGMLAGGEGAATGMGTQAAGSVTWGNALGGAMYGLNAIMSFSNGQTISGIGNTAAAVMSFIPGLQAFAPLVAIGSTLLQGMFGQDRGPPAAAGGVTVNSAGKVIRSDALTDNDGDPQQAAQLRDSIAQATQAFVTLAGTLNGDMQVGVEAKDGKYVPYLDGKLSSEGYTTLDEAVIASFRHNVSTGLIDASEDVLTAVQNSAATDINEFLKDVQLARGIAEADTALASLDTSLTGITAAAKKAAGQLYDTAQEEATRADALGLGDRWREVTEKQIRAGWAAAEQTIGPAAAALAKLDGEFEAFAEAVKKLGLNITEAEIATEKAAAKERLLKEARTDYDVLVNTAAGNEHRNSADALVDWWTKKAADNVLLGNDPNEYFGAKASNLVNGLDATQLNDLIAHVATLTDASAKTLGLFATTRLEQVRAAGIEDYGLRNRAAEVTLGKLSQDEYERLALEIEQKRELAAVTDEVLRTGLESLQTAEREALAFKQAQAQANTLDDLTLRSMAADVTLGKVTQDAYDRKALEIKQAQELATVTDPVVKAKMLEVQANERLAHSYKQTAAAQESVIKSGGSIRDFIDRSRSTAGIGVSASAALAAAQSQFDRDFGLAQAGDQDALQRVAASADRLLQAAPGVLASGMDFRTFQDGILAQLEGLPAVKSYDAQVLDKLTEIAAIGLSAADFLGLMAADLDKDQRISWPEFETWAGNNAAQVAVLGDALGLSNASLSDIFGELDVNGDGQLQRDEILNGLTRNILSTTSATAAYLAVLAADTNNDQRISWPEFSAWAGDNSSRLTTLATALGITNANTRDIFAKLDSNNSGEISRDEIAAAISRDIATGTKSVATGTQDTKAAVNETKGAVNETKGAVGGTTAAVNALANILSALKDNAAVTATGISLLKTTADATNTLIAGQSQYIYSFWQDTRYQLNAIFNRQADMQAMNSVGLNNIYQAITRLPHASGGPAAGLTMVNDTPSPEIIRLPGGSEVVTAASSIAYGLEIARRMGEPAALAAPSIGANVIAFPAPRVPAGGWGPDMSGLERKLDTLIAAVQALRADARRGDDDNVDATEEVVAAVQELTTTFRKAATKAKGPGAVRAKTGA